MVIGITMKENTYDFDDRLDHVLELHGVDPSNAYVSEREIGNGPQYAVEVREQDSSVQIFESQWYSESEFDAYLTSMRNLEEIMRKQG